MTENGCPAHDYTAIRRRDRAVDDDAWIGEFLASAAVGTLATVRDGQPFVNTNIFAYDADRHAILFHTAGTGRTRSNLEQSDKVCFTVAEMGRLLPAKRALNFSVEYSGVVVFGTGAILGDDDEAGAALLQIMAKYAPPSAARGRLRATLTQGPRVDERVPGVDRLLEWQEEEGRGRFPRGVPLGRRPALRPLS